MSLTLIIVLLALIKLSIAATLLLLPFLHDAAMEQADGSPGTDDDGGLRIAQGGGWRPRWPVTGGPTRPRGGGHAPIPRSIARQRGAHTPPAPLAPRRVRSPRRQPAQPAAR
jgi:hypothetical protein